MLHSTDEPRPRRTIGWSGYLIAAALCLATVIGTTALGASASGPAVAGAPGVTAVYAQTPLKDITSCQLFTLAEAKTLLGKGAKPDPGQSHTINFAGQRNIQCSYSSGKSGLAELQMLLPLTNQAATGLKVSFADNKVSFEGTTVKGLGSAAFMKTKVGAPALYVLTKDDATFNLASTTNGTNSASEAQLASVAAKIVKAL